MQALELKIPPLLLVLLFALAMWLLASLTAALSAQLALPALDTTVLALCLAVTGIAVALAGVLAFRRAQTTVDPRVPQQSSSLVIVGIYRYSRNPMYLGVFTVVGGLCLLFAKCCGFGLVAAVCILLKSVSDKTRGAFFRPEVWSGFSGIYEAGAALVVE